MSMCAQPTTEVLYPDYVSTDYDRWLFDHVIDRTLVDEWRSAVQMRRVLKSRELYGRSVRCWRTLDIYWHTLKRLYIEAGGLYERPWYVWTGDWQSPTDNLYRRLWASTWKIRTLVKSSVYKGQWRIRTLLDRETLRKINLTTGQTHGMLVCG